MLLNTITPLFRNDREFSELLGRSDRPEVVYFTLVDSDISKNFKVFPHRHVVRRSLRALVFPPASRPAPPAR